MRFCAHWLIANGNTCDDTKFVDRVEGPNLGWRRVRHLLDGEPKVGADLLAFLKA